MPVARNIVVGVIARTEAFSRGMKKAQVDIRSFTVGIEKTQRAVSRLSRLALAVVGIRGIGAIFRSAMKDVEGFAGMTSNAAAGKLQQAVAAMTEMRQSAVGLAQLAMSKFAPMLELLADKGRRLIDILSQLSWAQGAWILKIAAFIFLVPKIISGIFGLMKVMVGLTKAQIILQAFSGPAGLASLALGAMAAAAAIGALYVTFNLIEDSITRASSGVGQFNSTMSAAKHTAAEFNKIFSGATSGRVQSALAKREAHTMFAPDTSALALYRSELARLKILNDQAAISLTQYQSEVARVGEEYKKAIAPAERFAETIVELDKLRKQIYELGKTPRQLSELQFQRETGRPVGKGFNALWDTIEAQERLAKSQEEVAKIFADTRTPLEQYETTIGRLHELLDAGAVDWDTYGRAVRMAREKLEGGGAKPFNAGEFQVIRRGLVSVTGPEQSVQTSMLSEEKKQTQLLEIIAHKEGLS